MKNFTHLFLAGLFSLVCLAASAQQRFANPDAAKPARSVSSQQGPAQRTCISDEAMQKLFATDPQARARFEANQRMLTQQLDVYMQNRQHRTQAIINVPVVVHVMYANPSQVTDANVQRQIDTLNWFYGGSPLNQDSLRVYEPFRTAYGRTEIRFCLAQRTPANLPTTGITRTTTAATFTTATAHPSTIVAAWDPTKYMNVWVVNFTDGTLGYSFLPGAFSPSDGRNGFVCDYRAFGSGEAYLFPEYNLGKTAVHEIGHFFNLPHPFSGGCTPGDGIADTPPTNAPTFGCPTGPVLNACSPSAPGVMWQNHMDYADDACMFLFTLQQCARMMTAITTSPDRIGLTTSNGCTPPPAAGGNDARISAIINPASASSVGCSSVTPIVTIQNMGTSTLTSATINVRLNGGGPITSAWTGSLAQGASANVTLASLPVILGSNTLKVHTTLPNGLTDADATNDTATVTFTRIAQATMPVLNTFETSLTPAGWSASNPDADALAWFRFNPAGGSAGGSVWAAVMDNYSFDLAGTVDDIISPVINTTGLLANDSLLITFDLAHKNYPDPGFEDSLKVLVSTNCGATWTTVWSKGDPELATAGSSTGLYNPPAAADWKKQRVSIGTSLFGGGQIQVAIRNVNGFGNTMWLDNVNVDLKPRKDLQALTINRPNTTECVSSFIPSLTVRNNGGETVTAFKTGYILNNGSPVIQTHNISLAPGGGTTTVTFPSLTPGAGTHTIKLFTADPLTVSPGPDGTQSNDTLTRTFTVPVTVTNLVEGFEGSSFVPANWFLINANNDLTWIKNTPGRNSASAAFIDNWSTNTAGRIDIMQAPPVNTNGADSLVISFDVAHKNYPGAFDRLRVLVSTDCGATFTSVYSKSGATLATAGSSEDDYRNPVSSEWRAERISLNSSQIGAGTIVRFENLSDWGNNIFIDNINMAPKFKRDLEVRNLTPQVFCATNVTPVATIFNRGTETITAYTVSYSIDGATAIATNVTTPIAPGATANVTLTGATTTTGVHSVKLYSFGPVAVSGTGDQYIPNDTITRPLTVVTTITEPSLTQNFEGASFPPTGWGITNNDGNMTWQRGAGNNSTSAAYVRNFAYVASNEVDRLHSPVLSYTGVDSVKLTFDVSAALKLAVGPGVAQDKLTVLATKDCGNTFTTIYDKEGLALHTLGFDPNYPQTFEFTPGSSFYWRNESIDLTALGAPNGPLQIVFQNTSNFGNNVYVDNINLATKTLPPNLKSDGYVVYPSPFRDQFSIWHWQQPTNLRYVGVYTSSGQLLWRKDFNGNADKTITVDLSKHANGVYVVKMGYNGSKDVQVRIVKY